MRFLFIGDVVGRPGREILTAKLNSLKKQYNCDMIIVNAENSAHGKGLSASCARELYLAGADILTMGNHTWDNKAIFDFADDVRLVRPANYPVGTPGNEYTIYEYAPGKKPVAVINMLGRVYLQPLDCPFKKIDSLLEEIKKITNIIVLDFHAEVTSEKEAMGWYVDGRVSACLGTHTHVQTADERILPEGTAYITDVGMTGPRDGILGVKRDIIIKKFVTGLPVHHEIEEGVSMINGVVVEIDESNGKAISIERVQLFEEANKN